MPLEIPIPYNSKKIGKFGEILLKMGGIIWCLFLIFVVIYFGYKYYLTKDIVFPILIGVSLFTLFEFIKKDFKDELKQIWNEFRLKK